MSLLPIDTIEALRTNINMVIDLYGFDAVLYVPQNREFQEKLDIYAESPDPNFSDPANVKTFIEWKPSTKRLRNLGIFVEGELPIIAWIRGDLSIGRNSYLKIPLNYSMGKDNEEYFELVDQVVRNAYNATIVEAWKIVPYRR